MNEEKIIDRKQEIIKNRRFVEQRLSFDFQFGKIKFVVEI